MSFHELMRSSLSGLLRSGKSAIGKKEGQALPMVLILMAVGGLLIGPSLSYVGSGLKSGKVIEERMKEMYAVDAGLEHGLWTMKNSPPAEYPHSYMLADVNGFPVNVTLSISNVLWGFTIGESGVHSDALHLFANMTYDSINHVYNYSLSISNTDVSVVKLNYVMVTPPSGFSYVAGSTTGVTTDNPEVRGDPNGNMGFMWEFSTPRPSIAGAPDPTKGIYSTVYHDFVLNGPEGHAGGAGHIWVSAEREDIGTVSTSTAMKVVAEAMRDGVPSTKASSLVLLNSDTGDILVGTWLID